jgi:hypothetical protein
VVGERWRAFNVVAPERPEAEYLTLRGLIYALHGLYGATSVQPR